MSIQIERSPKFEYLPGRFVVAGETIRVSRGPIYIDALGEKHAFGERGRFTFIERLQVRREVFLLLSGDTGSTVLLPVKPRRTKYSLPGYKPRPYRFVKPRASARLAHNQKRKTKQP